MLSPSMPLGFDPRALTVVQCEGLFKGARAGSPFVAATAQSRPGRDDGVGPPYSMRVLGKCHFPKPTAADCRVGCSGSPTRPIPAVGAGFPAEGLRRAAADFDKLRAAAAHSDQDCGGL
jgi:hypothetical protein